MTTDLFSRSAELRKDLETLDSLRSKEAVKEKQIAVEEFRQEITKEINALKEDIKTNRDGIRLLQSKNEDIQQKIRVLKALKQDHSLDNSRREEHYWNLFNEKKISHVK